MADLNVQLHLLSKNKFKVEESPVEILVSMGFLCHSDFLGRGYNVDNFVDKLSPTLDLRHLVIYHCKSIYPRKHFVYSYL